MHSLALRPTIAPHRPTAAFCLVHGTGVWHDDEQSNSREMAVAAVRRELAALPHGWRALHGVQLGGEHIDHLLTGPAGIVALTTKFHPRARVATDGRRLQVNGVDVDHLQRSRIGVRRIRGLLSGGPHDHTPVHGGVVFVGLAECRITGSVPDTLVTVADRLARAVQQMPHVLSQHEADVLADTLAHCCPG